jgi:membrane associated rhomboid family serine protease
MDALLWRGVEVDMCARCKGVWFDAGELALIHGKASDGSLLGELRGLAGGGEAQGPCPRGDGRLRPVTLARLPLLQCDGCAGLFVGGHELRAVRQALSGRTVDDLSAIEIRERAEAERAQAAEEELRAFALGEARAGAEAPAPEEPAPQKPGGGSYLFQVLTGLPIEEHNRRERTPVFTWLLIAANAIAFFVLPFDTVLASWALYPEALSHGVGIERLVTSVFVHGGLFHLLGNMYFLNLFGDNVEDRMGPVGYLAFYLLCGIVAATGHVLSDPASVVPVVGASGAISGVMGAYAALFPQRRLISIFFFMRFPLRVWFWAFGWVAFQSLFAAAGAGGVAWWAHLVGFAVGFVVVVAARASGAKWAAAEK